MEMSDYEFGAYGQADFRYGGQQQQQPKQEAHYDYPIPPPHQPYPPYDYQNPWYNGAYGGGGGPPGGGGSSGGYYQENGGGRS